MKYTFNFSSINLGCNKNLVDTQFLMGRILGFNQMGKNFDVNYYADAFDDEVKYVFVNTCGFLSSGRKEMLDTLNELIGLGKKPIVLGCGVQYFQKLEADKKPEILTRVSLLSWNDLDKISILDLIKGYSSTKFNDFEFNNNIRAYTNVIYGFEYLKIAEGCNNNCSFCIIPKIRGKQKSLTIEKVLAETENMIKSGAEEIILLSQDTTRYGVDLYGKPYLFELLEKLEELPYDFRYRILYLYPDIVTLKHLEKLKEFKKFIPYFDIPLQHISSNVLKRMGRFYQTDYIYKFLEFINQNFEEKYIRTNLIVGFPGETEDDFNQLCEFVRNIDMDNIAIFEYHDEVTADSYKLDQKVDDKTITERFNILREIVDKKLEQKNSNRKGEQEGYVMDILEIENGKGKIENNIVVRPLIHAPEIDSYDTIAAKDIVGVYNVDGNVDIGTKIIYKI